MTLPIALFRLGGFVFTLYLFAYMLLYVWNHFNLNSELVEHMYSFTPKTTSVQEVLAERKNLNFRFWHWITICGWGNKRELYEQALKKKEDELDLR